MCKFAHFQPDNEVWTQKLLGTDIVVKALRLKHPGFANIIQVFFLSYEALAMPRRQSMSSESNINNLALGLAIAGTAQVEADNANQRAMDAEGRAMRAELDSARKTTDRDLQRRMLDAKDLASIALANSEMLKRELAEKEVLLTEWMHSNEVLKRLVTQYGKKLGMTDEQRQQKFLQCVIEVSEENPEFANTRFKSKAEKSLGISKP